MKISGFTFARNAGVFYYPIQESIRSVLPVCDEFVIALAPGDEDDNTAELISRIDSPKIRIVHTNWNDREKLGRRIYSQQTNIALSACTGDWCFYIQADEVLHEKGFPAIRESCARHLGNPRVEGLYFRYRHFWGDYDHCLVSSKWYSSEVRIIRNRIGAQSVGDAQSFRINGRKLRAAESGGEIFHYGYVRPPNLMQRRRRFVAGIYYGQQSDQQKSQEQTSVFEYGSLEKVPLFKGTHPAVMADRIKAFDWKHQLQYSGKSPVKHKHDRFKYRLRTFIEQKLFGGRQIFGYRGYRKLIQTQT
jgi:hypothetical protein